MQSLNDYENIVAFLFACIMVFLFILSVFVIMDSVKASVYARKRDRNYEICRSDGFFSYDCLSLSRDL